GGNHVVIRIRTGRWLIRVPPCQSRDGPACPRSVGVDAAELRLARPWRALERESALMTASLRLESPGTVAIGRQVRYLAVAYAVDVTGRKGDRLSFTSRCGGGRVPGVGITVRRALDAQFQDDLIVADDLIGDLQMRPGNGTGGLLKRSDDLARPALEVLG